MVCRLGASDVAAWVRDVLLAPGRERPVVAVTTLPHSDRTWIEPGVLEQQLEGRAEVVLLETGEATWALAEALPPRLDAYGGAVRVWWPGLRADSDPYDHRLFFVHSPDGAHRVQRDIVAAIRRGPGPNPPGSAVATAAATATGLAAAVAAGAARPARTAPPPWDRVAAELAVGDVVSGRVQNVKEFGAFVDLLPGVTGLVHKSEIDWTFVKDVGEFVQVGQVVAVQILAIDREHRRIDLSIKQAYGSQPRPLPALVAGGPPFVWTAEAAPTSPTARAAEGEESKLQSLEEQLAAATRKLEEQEDALAAAEQDRRSLREKCQDLRKELRAAEDRHAALGRRAQDDPLASERAFLLGVRLAYARLFDEGARHERPLQRMRVGASFLDSLRALDGVAIDKVVEVCAQVAAGTAHEAAAREVHQLRAGPRGAATRVREGDGAQAWRCALQVNTPSARRLHWWSVPGPAGATVEFASVGVHDDFSIPD